MLKKCISLWIVICLLMALTAHNRGNETQSGGQGQPPFLIAIN